MKKFSIIFSVTFIVITGYFIGATLQIREKVNIFNNSSENSQTFKEQNKKAMN